jgi:putative MATE family efflux protein
MVPTIGHASDRSGRSRDLTTGPIRPTLWRLTLPLALAFVINAVYSWTDMYFVSRLGDTEVAAIGFSDQINFVIFTIGSGFCVGTGIVVARRIGEERRRHASLVATQAFSFMVVYSSLAAVAIYFLLPSILQVLGLKGEILRQTGIFMGTLIWGYPANLLMFQGNATVRSTGNTVFPMAVLIISALANVIIDPILIFGMFGMPKLGLRGAAISTATAQWIGALVSAYGLYSGKLNIRLFRPTLRFDWSVITSIFRIGVPSSLQSLAVSSSRVVIISIANLFGTAGVTAYTIGQKVDFIVFMPIFATGIAIETLVSQNIGAGRFDRVRLFRRTALRDLGGVIIAMGVAIYFGAESLARLFSSNPEVIDLTIRYLHIAVFGYLFFVIGQTGTRSLSGAGHATRSMLLVMGMLILVQVPLAYLLSRHTSLGVPGIFLGVTTSYAVFALASSVAVRGEKWMRRKV